MVEERGEEGDQMVEEERTANQQNHEVTTTTSNRDLETIVRIENEEESPIVNPDNISIRLGVSPKNRRD